MGLKFYNMKKSALLILLFLISCSTLKTPPFKPVFLSDQLTSGESFSSSGSAQENLNVSSSFNKALESTLPTSLNAEESDKTIFKNYKVNRINEREPNWLRGYDFLGVTWDNKRASTLIAPDIVLMAKHYQRNNGDLLRFQTNNGGNYKVKLVDKVNLSMTDTTVGLLEHPVAGGTFYPVLPMGYDWEKILTGVTVFVTDQERKVLLYNSNAIDYSGRFSAYSVNQNVPRVLREKIINGDSGNPVFLAYGNKQLILLSTNWYGGWGSSGPSFANTEIQTAIIEAIKLLKSRN